MAIQGLNDWAVFRRCGRIYGPGGVRVELGHVGICAVWGRTIAMRSPAKGEDARDSSGADRSGYAAVAARLDELTRLRRRAKRTRLRRCWTAEEKKEFIDVTNQLKVLDDRPAADIGAATGDEYLVDACAETAGQAVIRSNRLCQERNACGHGGSLKSLVEGGERELVSLRYGKIGRVIKRQPILSRQLKDTCSSSTLSMRIG